ncbi:MAG: transketolase C-terminal domain-containing protein, partial [Oscillospiraceae bacterium]
LQRSYDMLLHDVAIQNLHEVFGVDRAGLVGEDGETHHGIFDVSYLSTIPGMTVLAPASFAELHQMLAYAVTDCTGPVAVRYPRGGEGGYQDANGLDSAALLRTGSDITLVTYGTLINSVLEVADLLAAENITAEVLKLNRVAPIDLVPILASVQKTGRLLVAEESIEMNSAGQRVAAGLAQAGCVPKTVILRSVGTDFVTHGTVAQLRTLCGLDVKSLFSAAKEACSHE